MKINKSKSPTRKIIVIALSVIIVAFLGYSVYAKSNDVWPFDSTDASQEGNKAINATPSDDSDIDETSVDNKTDTTESTATVAPEVEERVKKGEGSGQNTSATSGTGIFDTKGKDASNQSGGTSSKSGALTLRTPTNNQKLTSGMIVEGSTRTSKVYYRINDSLHGMIGSGRLAAESGKFSGELSVNTSAKTGTFEVYSLNSSGQEVNNINIQVKF